jgi:uncharacterized protein (DUF608 family)
MHSRIVMLGILAIGLITSITWALSGTKGTPIGGMGTGYVVFDALTGDFATSCLVPPAASDGEDDFFSKKSTSCGIHLFAGGKSTKKAKTTTEDAKCPLYTADFGVLNTVSFKLNAFGPYISGDNDLNYKLATSPLAFFEITATNTSTAAIEAAVAIEFTNKSASRATLLGGAANAVIDPESNNKAISFTAATFPPTGNNGNAYLSVECDNNTATYSAGAIGTFLTNGQLANTNGNLVAAKCNIPAGSSIRIKFVFAWWRTFISATDRYGTGKNDEENYYYHNFYATSKEVALFGMSQFDNVRNGVFEIVYRVLGSNFPNWYKDRLLNNTYPLIHNSQCAKDGRCAYWEGRYPIIGTIDQGQHAALWYVHNWPKNQWNELRYWLSTMFQGAYLGQVHHDFNIAPENWEDAAHFMCPWNNWDREDYWFQRNTKDWSDLNSMAIFKAYELMCATGNKDSMLVYFPKVLQVADRLVVMCEEAKSSLPIKSKSTYDSNGLESPQYASGVALTAFLAVEAMAKFVGNEAAAQKYRAQYTKAREEFRTEIYEKHDFCQNRTFAEGDIAGYSWGNYFCLEPVMDTDIVNEGCKRLWELYSSQGDLATKLGQWHFYTYDHWGGAEIARGNPDRAMTIHKWDRDWYYEGNPTKTFWQDLWSFINEQNSSYMTAPLVWRSYWQFTGYFFDHANNRLWIRPKIPTEMNKIIANAPLIDALGWGTLQYNEVGDPTKKQTQAITVTYDSPVTINELVLKNNTGTQTPYVVIFNGADEVKGYTTTVENNGFDKNIRVTFASPIQIGSSGLSIGVYTEQIGTITAKTFGKKSSLSIKSSGIRANRPIYYSVDKPGIISMELLTLDGVKIGTIMKEQAASAGSQTFFWNGKTLDGKMAATTMAVLKLSSSTGIVSKLVFTKTM